MRWVFYLVLVCAIFDFIIFKYGISNGLDILMPRLYVFLLVLLVLYTGFFVLLIEKKALMDKRPLLSLLILSPIFIYLFLHGIAFLANIAGWIKGILR